MFPQSLTPIQSLAPAADASGRTGKYVSLKNAVKATILVEINQGHASTVLIEPKQAEAVAGTNVKVLANAVQIWVNSDTANTANYTRVADAVNYTTTAATTPKAVIFSVDPAVLDGAGGFDCLTVVTGASNAGNITAAQIVVEPKYKQAAPPSVIAD
jgi:hypothetical protein